jgi:hypothetical protein
MFPLNILTYVKLGLIILLLLICGYAGYSFESSRFERYKETQQAKIQQLEDEHQAATDQIRKEKDVQINGINSQLLDAIVELRKRPSRTESPSIGQSGTGVSLSAEDAIFLEREAARADVLRTSLQACYEQYDTLSK